MKSISIDFVNSGLKFVILRVKYDYDDYKLVLATRDVYFMANAIERSTNFTDE